MPKQRLINTLILSLITSSSWPAVALEVGNPAPACTLTSVPDNQSANLV